MNAQRDVELFLRARFEATADTTVLDGQIESVLSATAGRRQQPAWLAALRSQSMTTTTRSFGRPLSTPAWALLIILALLVAISAVGLTTGTFRIAPAPIVNGPIVYGRYDATVDDTAVVIARADGSNEHVVLPAPVECPQLSPDGRQVLFAFGVVNVDGTDRRDFPGTHDGATLGCSTWSPDGRRVAIEGFNDTDRSVSGIYLADASDGGNVVRLTTNGQDGNDIPGDWSPDGRQIAFQREIGGDRNEMWTVDVANGAARRVTEGNLLGASWSPDGQWLVASGGTRFLMVRPDGADAHWIRIPALVGYANAPAFSPDGERLVFAMSVGTANTGDIYTMKIDGTELKDISNTPNDNEYFVDWGVDPR